MTKPRDPNPQPTSGTNYDSFLVPHSKTPAKQRIYDQLLELGWRYDAVEHFWWTPEASVLQGKGRLECAPDFSWARVQPVSTVVDGVALRAQPLLLLELTPAP